MFARKLQIDVIDQNGARPCPIAWLDSFSMRSFTGRSAFDETLPIADGLLEASFTVNLDALKPDMEDWFTRKFGAANKIQLRFSLRGSTPTR